MNVEKFVSRRRYLSQLTDLLKKKSASLVAITGRRRVGKTRLIAEFVKTKPYLGFFGLTPEEGITAQDQRDHFMRSLSQQTDLPFVTVDDWSDVFALLVTQVQKEERVIVALDEISWMAEGDGTFLAKLKVAWEHLSKANPKLILILCGSISSWVEENIISSSGYFGRLSLKINLKQLSIAASNEMLNMIGFKYSAFEKLIILSVTGGVPWYLEQINPEQSALQNIQRLYFSENGILVEDYKYIFHNLFGKRGVVYSEVVEFIINGMRGYDDIQNNINYEKSGALSKYMNDLVLAGFTQRHFSWQLNHKATESKLSLYRLSDNYLRFYLKYIKPRINKIQQGIYRETSLMDLAGWNSMLGLQFEALVLNNPEELYKALGISLSEIVAAGPFFQRKTTKQQGCQIDYLIQTKYHTLFVIEIKVSRIPIGVAVIDEVESKINRISKTRDMACIPVLIYAGELSDELVDRDYFMKKVNYMEFLK